MEKDLYDLLSSISQNLDRIASALDGYNNAAIRRGENTPDGYIEIFATTHGNAKKEEKAETVKA